MSVLHYFETSACFSNSVLAFLAPGKKRKMSAGKERLSSLHSGHLGVKAMHPFES